jgi:sterol desaturase/sphingolipid hydroxylase (fatty acid hydroxylase superfamily)
VNLAWDLEPWLRVGVFLGLLLLLAGAELLAPRRPPLLDRRLRWPGNLSLVVLDALLLRILLPLTAVGAAVVAEEREWGLFNLTSLPSWLEIGLAVVLLDLVLYGQHVLFHSVPWLWRIHRVHHADIECDVTTGLRFHPAEILLSMAIKMAAVLLLGAAGLAVLLFEILLNAASMWSHANVRLPEPADRLLRRLIVTPDMHRTHHSVAPRETHSNFGFHLACWDRLFGTYREQPEAGHEKMIIGIPEFRSAAETRLDRLLSQPFRHEREKGDRR